jgi:hypothetical protein
MSPRHAREILKSWVRGDARTPSLKHPSTEQRDPCAPNAPQPDTPASACPLSADQRHALYHLLTRHPEGGAECPPLKPEHLPPP